MMMIYSIIVSGYYRSKIISYGKNLLKLDLVIISVEQRPILCRSHGNTGRACEK